MTRRSRLGRWFLIGVVAWVAVFTGLAGGGAQESGVTVTVNDAMLEFPSGFRFRLDAESPEQIVRAELRYSIPPDDTINVSVADLEPGTSISLEHTLDLVVNYVPPGLDIIATWLITTEGGNESSTGPQSLFWHDDRFDWELFESEDVRIYSYADDGDFTQQMVEMAQSSVDNFESRFGVTTVVPVNFWLYERKVDMESALAPNSRDWIGGVTLPEFPTISAVLASGDEYGAGRLIPHEIAHQVLYQATRNPFAYLANWLDEGLATTVQLTGTDGFDHQVESALENGTLPTIQSLIAEWPADRQQAAISYASAYSIVQFILSKYGEEALGTLIAGYKNGLSHDDALMAALGVTTVELDLMWRESLA